MISASVDGKTVYEKKAKLSAKGWSVLLLEDVPTDKPGELVINARLPQHPWVKEQSFFVTIDNRITSYNVCYTKLLRCR